MSDLVKKWRDLADTAEDFGGCNCDSPNGVGSHSPKCGFWAVADKRRLAKNELTKRGFDVEIARAVALALEALEEIMPETAYGLARTKEEANALDAVETLEALEPNHD